MTSCEPRCQRTVPHDPPGECWTSGLGIARTASFVRLTEDLAGLRADPALFAELTAAEDRGELRTVFPDDPTEVPYFERNTIALPISLELALDYNLLEPGTPQYEEAVERRRQHTERLDAWRRSWPGRRARARGLAVKLWHDVRHRLARVVDPDCIGYADES